MGFLSTPPSRVATKRARQKYACARCFYPRHPRGWRLNYIDPDTGLFSVSIHATLAGGDAVQLAVRTDAARVSIHATLAGGDRKSPVWQPVALCFYPRHPRGWRRPALTTVTATLPVSIHATLAGGDADPERA